MGGNCPASPPRPLLGLSDPPLTLFVLPLLPLSVVAARDGQGWDWRLVRRCLAATVPPILSTDYTFKSHHSEYPLHVIRALPFLSPPSVLRIRFWVLSLSLSPPIQGFSLFHLPPSFVLSLPPSHSTAQHRTQITLPLSKPPSGHGGL